MKLRTCLLAAIMAVFAQSFPAIAEGRRVALIVANEAYPEIPLENPKADASLVVAALESIGFDATLITDASLPRFAEAVESFAREATGADVALFYYAGHGFSINAPDDVGVHNYLMATSADLTSHSPIILRSGGIKLDDVIVPISKAADVALFFIDACRNLPGTRGGSRGLAAIDQLGNEIFVAASTRLGTVALDGEPGESSPFARSFAKHIVEPGLRLDDAFVLIRKDVEAASEGQQRPDIVRLDLDEPIVLVSRTQLPTQDSTVAVTPVTPSVPQPIERRDVADLPELKTQLLDSAQMRALTGTVEAFDAAMQAGDMAVVVKTVPDKMLTVIAEQFGADKDELLEQMITQTEEAMKTVTITEFEMDIDNAEYLETPDGTPYALIPSRTVIDTGTAKVEAKSSTLGLLDEGSWYLIRVDDQSQVQFLQKAYPSFIGVSFPAGTVTPVTE